jgi:four helix bundle protein
MKVETFEDLICWQKAKELAVITYSNFKTSKDFSFKDQMQRAVISISNNIAEGFERRGNKEFSYFLSIAKGSCGEVRSMLYIALDLRYINQEVFDDLFSRSLEISKIISALGRSL